MIYGHAVEQADAGIRVNCVRPGTAWSETNRQHIEKVPEHEQRIISKAPLGRATGADESAHGIVRRLSDEASFTTGALLDNPGGMTAPWAIGIVQSGLDSQMSHNRRIQTDLCALIPENCNSSLLP